MIVERVAVGSQNPVKIAAAREAVYKLWPDVYVNGIEVSSGVSDQPMHDEDAIEGALNRAQQAREKLNTDLGIGLEGNVVDTPYGMFTSGWAVVIDRAGRVGVGAGGRIHLPEPLAAQVRAGQELGHAIDAWTGERNTKQRQGAVGVLTGGLISRQDALCWATVYALARFVREINCNQ